MIDFEDMSSGWQIMANTSHNKYRTGLGTHGTKIYAFGSGAGRPTANNFLVELVKTSKRSFNNLPY